MKKLFTYFFVTLGVIFFALLCASAYIWFADPFGIRPIIEMIMADDAGAPQQPASSESSSEDKNPTLSPGQEEALKKIGIDPAKIPSEITPEMKTCFTNILGAPRVAEIEGGATPTPSEVVATRNCYGQ